VQVGRLHQVDAIRARTLRHRRGALAQV
jgi:hypothetical protein